jgi:xanthine/CO dehydrogenase XdhC/CoxF family maturation factor
MLLKGDVTTIVQKWGSTPRHAGSKRGLASEGQFSTRVVQAAFDSSFLNQTRHLYFWSADETPEMRWMLIEAGTRIGCV